MRAIDVDALEKDIRENYEKYANSDAFEEQFLAMRFKQIEQYIKAFPVVEVEPIKRGKWVRKQYCNMDDASTYCANCSECGVEVCLWEHESYCPSCGAKMGDENYD